MNKISGVTDVIAIASGKGGVGKSTTAVNLALALRAKGYAVGLLDADIYGPSQPSMLGVTTTPDIRSDQGFLPVVAHGIKSMSIGYLIDADTPMIWRGPMVSRALQQLAYDTVWGKLDYLIVDLPPGTGDIVLTLAQKIPLSGALIVSTPQDIALLDARKALEMLQKVKVNVLGVVENMSVYICPACGHQAAIFGEGGGKHMAEHYQLPLLGRLPLALTIRQQTDQGTPPLVAEPKGEVADLYHALAAQVLDQLSLRPKPAASPFPDIVVERPKSE